MWERTGLVRAREGVGLARHFRHGYDVHGLVTPAGSYERIGFEYVETMKREVAVRVSLVMQISPKMDPAGIILETVDIGID